MNSETLQQEIQSHIRKFFKNLNSSKLKNIKEMDKFLDPCKTPKLNQKKKKKSSTPVTSEKISNSN